MASKKSTNISLSILGLAGVVGVAYFIWIFLAPPPATMVVGHTISTEINKKVIESGPLKDLQPYVSLPIKGGAVGRDNPFLPFSVPAATNDAANGGAEAASGGTAPLMNLPETPSNNGTVQ